MAYRDKERQKAYQKEWYKQKRANDPEWLEKQNARHKEWKKLKYAADLEWREKQNARDRQHRAKQYQADRFADLLRLSLAARRVMEVGDGV